MAVRGDKAKVLKALREVGVTKGFHVGAALILLSVNGLENALGYIRGIVEKGLVDSTHQLRLF
jgi:hypothetical protein